ncbi:MAG: hypothetical protein NDI90_11130 [Nitrospira sp. BO4]|jgi:hypothetical protein|nr:hypothetical protein [Nitrospira sp. BO4]
MANTVRGFFRTLAHAEQTKLELAILKKIPTLEMQVYDQPGVQPTARSDAAPSGVFESPQALLPEGVRRGGPVLEVTAEACHIDAIADVLDQCGAEDISIFTAAVGQEE